VTGEAILSAENSGKPLDGRDSRPNLAVGAHSASLDPSWWGPRCCCILSKNLTPALGIRPLLSAPFRLAASVLWCWSWEKEGEQLKWSLAF